MAETVVIVAAKRTPLGSFQGVLAPLSASELGAEAISAALADAGMQPNEIDEVLMGCVLPAGVGQAPARQAALKAGLPISVGATTLNKVCGSAMKAIMFGYDMIRAGSARVIIAGGMESMTNAPYLVQRQGKRMGHRELIDHMFFDGLQNHDDGLLMGCFGDRCAEKLALTRAEQDAFATESVRRAMAANTSGDFNTEIAPVRSGKTTVERDEEPFRCDIAKIPNLKPAFGEKGTVTAASAASIADGAAALVLMSQSEATKRGLSPIARIVGHASHAMAPEDFPIAPIDAIRKLCTANGWREKDVDLYEINEAFAAVTLAAIKTLKLDPTRVNIHGGACALGHPLGATGARIVVTLIHALRQQGLKRGVASLCIGGGEATALGIEIP